MFLKMKFNIKAIHQNMCLDVMAVKMFQWNAVKNNKKRLLLRRSKQSYQSSLLNPSKLAQTLHATGL